MPYTTQPFTTRPVTVLIPLLMTLPGIAAIILGDHASKVFTEIGGSILIRVIGLTFVLGGALVALGTARADPILDTIGTVFTGMGCALFGIGSLIVQGSLGIVAGSLSLSVAVAFSCRVWSVTRGPVSRG